MSTQDESWKEQFSDSNEGSDRDGYRPQPSSENQTGGFSRSGRPLRPRISRPAFSANADGRTSRPSRPYVPREGGNSQPRPRYNREEGYQPRSNEGS